MNATLWILQILLALAFAAHGWLFLSPPPDIAVLMDASYSRGFQIFMGIAEIAAAAGLILPGVTRILPQLVPAAAAGIVLIMIGAVGWHLMRSEFSSAAITLVLLAMAAFVAWMRWKVLPIRARA